MLLVKFYHSYSYSIPFIMVVFLRCTVNLYLFCCSSTSKSFSKVPSCSFAIGWSFGMEYRDWSKYRSFQNADKMQIFSNDKMWLSWNCAVLYVKTSKSFKIDCIEMNESNGKFHFQVKSFDWLNFSFMF